LSISPHRSSSWPPSTKDSAPRSSARRTSLISGPWFGVPDEWTPIGAIAVGHPDLPADPVPPARISERKSLAELVHRGRW